MRHISLSFQCSWCGSAGFEGQSLNVKYFPIRLMWSVCCGIVDSEFLIDIAHPPKFSFCNVKSCGRRRLPGTIIINVFVNSFIHTFQNIEGNRNQKWLLSTWTFFNDTSPKCCHKRHRSITFHSLKCFHNLIGKWKKIKRVNKQLHLYVLMKNLNWKQHKKAWALSRLGTSKNHCRMITIHHILMTGGDGGTTTTDNLHYILCKRFS